MRATVNDDNSLTISLENGMGSFIGYPKELFGVGTKLDIYNDSIEEFFGVKTVKPDKFTIKKVIFNKPATIVFWADGTKTVVKCADFDIWDPEKGLAMAICKRVYGDEFHKIFKDFMPEEDEESEYPNIPLSNWFNAFSMNKEDK